MSEASEAPDPGLAPREVSEAPDPGLAPSEVCLAYAPGTENVDPTPENICSAAPCLQVSQIQCPGFHTLKCQPYSNPVQGFKSSAIRLP